jgi:hypothetical protein
MTLLKLYEKHVHLIGLFLQKSNSTTNGHARDSYRSRALAHQEQAGGIAHCIALFGNLPLDEVDIERLRECAKTQACVQENPWSRGITTIQRELEAMK